MFGSDVFGRLLYLSVRKNIDLDIVFQYPLLPEPPCFLHSDKKLRESRKSSVIHCLKEKLDYSSPTNVNSAIADGMFAVRSSLKEKGGTFESFARHVLIKLFKITNYSLDLCFDIYESSSIKGIKRKSRGDRDLEKFSVLGRVFLQILQNY